MSDPNRRRRLANLFDDRFDQRARGGMVAGCDRDVGEVGNGLGDRQTAPGGVGSNEERFESGGGTGWISGSGARVQGRRCVA